MLKAVACLPAILGRTIPTVAEAKTPNVVLIMVDDT
jgi:hypothetical protein